MAVDHAPHPDPYPSVAPLKNTLVLDLDVPWWQAWFKTKSDPHQQANELARLIRSDFQPIVAEMAREAHTKLMSRIARTLQQAHAVSTGMLKETQNRKLQLIGEYEHLGGRMDGTGGAANIEMLEQQQQAKAALLSDRQARAQVLAAELTS